MVKILGKDNNLFLKNIVANLFFIDGIINIKLLGRLIFIKCSPISKKYSPQIKMVNHIIILQYRIALSLSIFIVIKISAVPYSLFCR
jgi:hypothetical protein